MATAPRSAGTESVSAFREELNKLLPAPSPSAPAMDADELRSLIQDVLVPGTPLPVGAIAARVGSSVDAVLAALRLPADTSPEQTVVRADEPPSVKPSVKRRKAPDRS